MNIGSTVKFAYKNEFGAKKFETWTLTREIVEEKVMSNAEVIDRLAPNLQRVSSINLETAGYLYAARYLLNRHPKATEIEMQELEQKSSGSGDAGMAIVLLAVIAILVAIICFPLLVMLGMHRKLFLKGFYEKYEGKEYDAFVKNYTFIGIGLYALVALLIIIDKIFSLFLLVGPAFGLLFFGGIAYFVGSLLLTKKKFAQEGAKINFFDTIKGAFKKKDKE